ncbi:hypothetical protein BOX15_Mlig003555g1 [Macrostomum lignano]|uniref:Uncharacterized protein n=1 Tax=Macrostomum lignano TaxID=282301 RepID=A0A267EQT8_9PLAT|nr:hypothetical protein BOX15_Mlig003555g1 [Macrostomum lignano]
METFSERPLHTYNSLATARMTFTGRLTHLATFLALVPLLICVLHTEAVITDSDDYRALPQDFNGLEKKASQRVLAQVN